MIENDLKKIYIIRDYDEFWEDSDKSNSDKGGMLSDVILRASGSQKSRDDIEDIYYYKYDNGTPDLGLIACREN